MDGNGRWAKERGKARVFGHKAGAEAVRKVVEAAAEISIEYLTLYTFSKENWHRSKSEVSALMSLLINTINRETKTLMKNNIRLLAICDIEDLPDNVLFKLKEAINITSKNTGLSLILAISYSSRWEILETVQRICKQLENKEITTEGITEKLFEQNLNTAAIPDPELLIRTSGEFRISNFLLWQIAYSELYFTDKFWPDFGKEEFYQAIISYQNRERRFGKTSEQLKFGKSR